MGKVWGELSQEFGVILWAFFSFLYLGREFKHNNFNLGLRFVGLNRLCLNFNLNFSIGLYRVELPELLLNFNLNFNIDFRNDLQPACGEKISTRGDGYIYVRK